MATWRNSYSPLFNDFHSTEKEKQHCFKKPGGRIPIVAFDMDWEEEERSAKNHLVENSNEIVMKDMDMDNKKLTETYWE